MATCAPRGVEVCVGMKQVEVRIIIVQCLERDFILDKHYNTVTLLLLLLLLLFVVIHYHKSSITIMCQAHSDLVYGRTGLFACDLENGHALLGLFYLFSKSASLHILQNIIHINIHTSTLVRRWFILILQESSL